MTMEDDVMLWRMIYLYMISNYIKKAREKQPESPKGYMAKAVSFWDTKEWAAIKGEFNLTEVTFNQGDHRGKAGSLQRLEEIWRWWCHRRGREGRSRPRPVGTLASYPDGHHTLWAWLQGR